MNTPLWSAQDAAMATGGEAHGGDWAVSGISIDTRSIEPGELFVALKDVRDGHDFVAQSLEKGAGAALVSRIPDGVPADAPLLLVADVLTALEDLGRAGRARSRAKVIGVTGSVGKTSTKEMLRTVLERQGKVHAAEKSFNNHWGVPITLARLPADADFAVIEIGMNHPGEIAPLSRMAAPHVALITTVAPAHLEAFESIDGIAHEKASIFEGLTEGGTAIFNTDVPTAPILAEVAAAKAATVVRFGTAKDADYVLETVALSPEATVIRATAAGEHVLFKLSLPAPHFALNALGVLACVEAVGGDIGLAASDMALWQPPAGRGTKEIIILDPTEDDLAIELIDDAFNANPVSMAAAFQVLAASKPKDGLGKVSRGRRIAILGDMLELGEDEAAQHRALAQNDALQSFTLIHCVGPRMKHLWDALPPQKRGHWVAEADALVAKAHHLLDAGDVILVKGSKGSYVSRVVDAIRKQGRKAAKD
ncbi:UDP-N-acetylmuramoyl-tripeptide--D-alanyl-D-alanine ligase [Pseudoruegeria sp. SHC-113]|uniref:UDP-N-acetylmuramoyl-tripeptide--D-alanyl-D- alanine ligase n=1 Tax=Pseudoruegeria sp. SHC-113 TaxID=2855439 RepID=UPI0021BB5116|nr:UDP-N-acetylmuramoyl-tripeptide--D-alanyl-D-alanine ligase [Pseudoruegeria sp. SHC-113]MCT8161041.1 UDP-N-acetylmuramoyl-tripeptide--D-alanyl-D-alanine ligase [Pseudoruegeria sp. SHC-113]